MLRFASILSLLLLPAVGRAQPARSFDELIAEAPFIVRASVERTGSTSQKVGPGRSVTYELAVLRVRAFLRGDPVAVLPAYRKRFPVFSASIYYDGGRHGHAPAPLASALYVQKVGAELILFVDLPSKERSSRGQASSTRAGARSGVAGGTPARGTRRSSTRSSASCATSSAASNGSRSVAVPPALRPRAIACGSW